MEFSALISISNVMIYSNKDKIKGNLKDVYTLKILRLRLRWFLIYWPWKFRHVCALSLGTYFNVTYNSLLLITSNHRGKLLVKETDIKTYTQKNQQNIKESVTIYRGVLEIINVKISIFVRWREREEMGAIHCRIERSFQMSILISFLFPVYTTACV